MKLAIVESPSKAKTINKYLGKDYTVLASYGHIRQLVAKKDSVNPNNNFAMTWEETTQAKKNLKKIKDALKESDEIYLATDPDREGEAISWHLISYLKEKKLLKKNIPVKRVVFNSITKKDILAAFDNPRELKDDLVSAYLARTALDYLVGFNISPILWRKLPGSRSAGRVQSIALRLICERENEIESFKPVEYWSLIVNLYNETVKELKAKPTIINKNKVDQFFFKNEQEVKAAEKQILSSMFTVVDKKEKTLTRNPFAPFTTSSLQQDAFNKLGFTTKRTMQIAQKLYEGIKLSNEVVGLITYMRTDATQISPEATNEIRNLISSTFGSNYMHSSTRVYSTKAKNAQEAHEAVRPTNISLTPEKASAFLDTDMLKLYTLIWKRSVASQMSSAKYSITTYKLENEDKSVELSSSNSVMSFDGFYKVYNYNEKQENSEENSIPNLSVNDKYKVKNNDIKQHFTEPPARYSEASLVKTLEEAGIGRPSTYANIISVLQERKYTRVESRRFVPEARGRILNVFLVNYFKTYLQYNFTANMEEQLDKISNGELSWKQLLSDFWKDFEKNIEEVKNIDINHVIQTVNSEMLPHFVGEETTCPKCKKANVQIKNSKFGAFLGCENYPDCTYTHALETSDDGEAGEPEETNKSIGEIDGKEVFIKKGPYGWYLEQTDKKPKRSSIPKTMDHKNIDLDKAKFLLSLPLKLDEDIVFNIGPYGPYIKHGSNFISYKEDIFSITLEKARSIIKEKASEIKEKNLGKHPETAKDIIAKTGRYGPYISYNKKNFKINKKIKISELSLDKALEIIESQQT